MARVSDLLRLWRRREVALSLLDEYDREPVDIETALRQLQAFASSPGRDFPAWQERLGSKTWAEAVRAKAKEWPA